MILRWLLVFLVVASWGAVFSVTWAQDDEAEALAEVGPQPDEEESLAVLATKGFPRFASLKKAEVNVRSGPGNQYPILWVYTRAGYPVQLLARYDNYFKLRDVEGEEGWAYVGMVSAKKTALVGGKEPIKLLRRGQPDAVAMARLAPGVVVELDDCEASGFCRVEAGGYKGWVVKTQLEMVD
ncbi:MAG: hypothetical protein EBQ80_01855 [Proteobacteria bacterium]|nr:hypothetical protein [Pseudomonadota bacterium]